MCDFSPPLGVPESALVYSPTEFPLVSEFFCLDVRYSIKTVSSFRSVVFSQVTKNQLHPWPVVVLFSIYIDRERKGLVDSFC